MQENKIQAGQVICSNCHRPYPEEGVPYRCPVCTGVYDLPVLTPFDPAAVRPEEPGLWRYRFSLGLPAAAPVITLGEGNTPLVWDQLFGRRVALKLEFANPTGSYKDRGSAVLISFLRSRGVGEAVEDSSGNAGASFAAYAARAGMRGRVFVPDYAAGPKRVQIEAYGAEVVRILGTRSQTAEACLRAVEAGAVYASHAYLPQGLTGYATLAYELYEQLGQAPGAVILPAGQGNLLLAVGRGFQALQSAGLISSLPRLVGVQALACAPLFAAFHYGAQGLSMVREGETVAEGVRVRFPRRGDAVLQMVQDSAGTIVAIEEELILPARDQLARRGFYVEATSAIVWPALERLVADLPDPIVLVLTGSGLKNR